MMDNTALRERLDVIVESKNGPVYDDEDLARQLVEIQDLSTQISSAILPYEVYKENSEERKLNCHAFALSNLLSIDKNLVVTSKCLEKILENQDEDPEEWNLIVYYEIDSNGNQAITHSGIRHEEVICSKWGGGHAWLHAKQDVPLQYGELMKFFQVSDELGVRKRIKAISQASSKIT